MDDFVVQRERLSNAYLAAYQDYSEAHILDLTHSLRIWIEAANSLMKMDPLFSEKIFFTASPKKQALRSLKRDKCVLTYFPRGVNLNHPDGWLVWGPADSAFSISMNFETQESRKVLYNYCYVYRQIDDHSYSLLPENNSKKLNYKHWLNAEILRLSNGDGNCISISRDVFIKRVANEYGSSHPTAAEKGMYAEYIEMLMDHEVGEYKLPFIMLMKVAQDILEATEELYIQRKRPRFVRPPIPA